MTSDTVSVHFAMTATHYIIQFCEWAFNKVKEHDDFLNYFLFSMKQHFIKTDLFQEITVITIVL